MYIDQVKYERKDSSTFSTIHLNVEGRNWSHLIFTGINSPVYDYIIKDIYSQCFYANDKVIINYDNLLNDSRIINIENIPSIHTFIPYITDKMDTLRLDQAYSMLDDDMEEVQKITVTLDRYIDVFKLLYPSVDIKFVKDRAIIIDKKVDKEITRSPEKLKNNFKYKYIERYICYILDCLKIRVSEDMDVDTIFDIPCIVFIDNIGKDFTLNMQSKIMSILIRVFPNAQFIVSTDSPLIVKNCPNAVVHNLNSGVSATNINNMSYNEILKIWFEIN